jgi:hypothetical protein
MLLFFFIFCSYFITYFINKGFYGPNQPLSFFAGQDTIAHASVNLFDLSYDMVSQLTFESVKIKFYYLFFFILNNFLFL